eukprot:CAMPEP_0175546662 /NCGR_PEP_ID=MMETSP0096-20121207/29901_1 /TAXON_ID=311494 /ORGANISM="Alexandrium monilatum, Strain CCMP3105" /LENGTH=234 /DNA_ID=CAMNT_0016849639 /DNA_START=33 /DNA_END=737 /DNA_ORIENTATION=+
MAYPARLDWATPLTPAHGRFGPVSAAPWGRRGNPRFALVVSVRVAAAGRPALPPSVRSWAHVIMVGGGPSAAVMQGAALPPTATDAGADRAQCPPRPPPPLGTTCPADGAWRAGLPTSPPRCCDSLQLAIMPRSAARSSRRARQSWNPARTASMVTSLFEGVSRPSRAQTASDARQSGSVWPSEIHDCNTSATSETSMVIHRPCCTETTCPGAAADGIEYESAGSIESGNCCLK